MRIEDRAEVGEIMPGIQDRYRMEPPGETGGIEALRKSQSAKLGVERVVHEIRGRIRFPG
jgi:hypothetical protein